MNRWFSMAAAGVVTAVAVASGGCPEGERAAPSGAAERPDRELAGREPAGQVEPPGRESSGHEPSGREPSGRESSGPVARPAETPAPGRVIGLDAGGPPEPGRAETPGGAAKPGDHGAPGLAVPEVIGPRAPRDAHSDVWAAAPEFHLDTPVPTRPSRPPAADETGERQLLLTLRSTPSHAVVSIDGVTIGRTPTVWSVPASHKPREFTFVLPGYAMARYRFVPVVSGVVHGTLTKLAQSESEHPAPPGTPVHPATQR